MKQTFSGYISAIKTFITVKKKTSIFLLILIAGSGYYIYNSLKPVPPSRYVLALAKKATIVSSVSGSGQVLSENQLSIKPLSSGSVVSLNVTNGQYVHEGQVLATLDERSANVSLNQAKASVESAQASYDKLTNGATNADVQVTQISVDSSKQDLVNKIKNTYTQTDNTIRTTIDQLYKDANSYITPQFQLSFFDSSINSPVILTIPDINQSSDLGYARQHMTTVLKSMKTLGDSLSSSSSNDDVKTAATVDIGYMNELRDFLTNVSIGLNSISFNASKYKSNIDSYKTSVASARSSVDSTISDLLSSQNNLISIESQLALKKTPPRPEDVASAQAQLDSAKASLQSAENNYANNIIRAPFDGIVAGMTIQKGDQAGPSTAVATLITKQKIAEIPLNEVDVAKVKVGQKATLTFDALPDLSIAGVVTEVDPLGTVSQNVVTYNVKISFDTQDDRVKPNMSVSASIVTGLDQDVLTVPNESIKTKNNVAHVQVATGITTATDSSGVTLDTAPVDVVVQTSLSNDKVTEIVSGLKEGDAVVTKTVAGTVAVTTTQQSGLSLLGGSSNRGAVGGAARALGR